MSGVLGGKAQTIPTSQEPWSGVQPFLNDIFHTARGQYFAPTQAQGLMTQRALDPNSPVSQAQGQLVNTIQGDYLNPERNPAFKASVQDALGLAGSAFAKQYGGAAGQNLGNSGYQEALARGLGATATNAYANAYGQERQNQLNALQLAPALGFADVNQVAAAEQIPWQKLSGYHNALSGFGGGTSQQAYHTNPLANVLGLGLGGAALATGLGGLGGLGLFGGTGGTGMTSPWMANTLPW